MKSILLIKKSIDCNYNHNHGYDDDDDSFSDDKPDEYHDKEDGDQSKPERFSQHPLLQGNLFFAFNKSNKQTQRQEYICFIVEKYELGFISESAN